MELRLYQKLREALLGELAARAEAHDPDYQRQVEAFASKAASGVPRPHARKIQGWLEHYNRLMPQPFKLRYYQILALYFTEHVLSQKRDGQGFADQKALAYWMATGSGKTLLMHLNILQYIDHIGGSAAFDELQIILTTPGVNLIEQHQRELGEVVRQLNRQYNQRITLLVETTGALLNKEAGFFRLSGSSRVFRLVLVDEGHIGLAGGGKEAGAFKRLRAELAAPDNAFLFEYSATYHGIADKYVSDYGDQIVYDYNYYRFFKDGYGKDYALQSLADDRFADTGGSEAAFFDATLGTLEDKLRAHRTLTVGQAQGAGQLPFAGRFPDKPLVAFMGNTVEDPKKEGKTDKDGEGKDEVSDIRKFLVWLAHLDAAGRARYASVFNHEHEGLLTLTRSPGISDEIWLSWGEGHYWGLINVGNGEKFFSDCEAHPQLRDAQGQMRVVLHKAAIVQPRYHFGAIDDAVSPINVLVGSRKFAEGWNCFRVSIIGLVNLGTSKGNKIIQIFGRGVRLKGLRHDGKRRHIEHCPDYAALAPDTPDNQLRRLETLNVFSLRKSWLKTFLDALEKDLPAVAGPYVVPVEPAVVRVGKSGKLPFSSYQGKLHAFKVGQADFDEPLRVELDVAAGNWHWHYTAQGKAESGSLTNPGFALDYRANRDAPGENVLPELLALAQGGFVAQDRLRERLRAWERDKRIQGYARDGAQLRLLRTGDLLLQAREVLYDRPLAGHSGDGAARMLLAAQRDLADKLFHKLRYDIDRRHYRYGVVRQSAEGEPGDFIDSYRLTYEFADDDARRTFEGDGAARKQMELDLREPRGEYHIYAPLLTGTDDNPVLAKTLARHKLQRVGISPDSLNAGERKFLRDLLAYVEQHFQHDAREFYLMRNVESLRSIGVYLEGETRAFYPDFVLWIVDDQANKTTLALFDPKGQTGIVRDDDLGLGAGGAMNDKVRIATSGQLAELAHQLKIETQRNWRVESFILLRDKSPLGKWKGAAPTDAEMDLAERMIQHHVLRLDWHDRDEQDRNAVRLRGGQSYLNRIFSMLD